MSWERENTSVILQHWLKKNYKYIDKYDGTFFNTSNENRFIELNLETSAINIDYTF